MEIADLSWNEVTLKRFNNSIFPRSIRGLIIGKLGSDKMIACFNFLLRSGWLNYDNLYVFGKVFFNPNIEYLEKPSKKIYRKSVF